MALVAALCLLTQLSSFAHMLLVRHATCPEHGELIHSDGGIQVAAGGPRDERVAVTAESRMPSVGATPEALAGHGHDHCAVFGHRRDATVIAARASADLAPLPALAVVQGGRRPLPLAFTALYLLAPKNSPPA